MIIRGKIKKNNQRGKSLGFPTANIDLTEDVAEGIYISKVNLENTWYPALTFIGAAKTFDEKIIQAENYILDFNKDIYGQVITIELIKKIRGNKKFNSAKELVNQMKKDEQKTREYFQNSPLD